MLRLSNTLTSRFALALCACGGFALSAAAQEFRVETEVFVADEPEPASRTVTLFENGAVYEFIDEAHQIVVYRRGNEDRPGRFILLDTTAKRRTDVPVDRMDALMEKIQAWAAVQKDPMMKFSAEPDFKEQYDRELGQLTLSSKEWTYKAATVTAEDAAALIRYRDFTDAYAKLNALMHGEAPPGPRLALNAALEKHGIVPVEIRRILGNDEDTQVRAAHLFSWRLSRNDRSRIDEAQRFLANYEKVDNETYRTALR
ncbi:MAG: hypothetical protein CMJ58_23295 [Planctomycetaceae bacterium]|nr:hypothetical protein [Planctomycetaceae bacterium]